MAESIGISLSGGGSRAAAFALGVLLYLSKCENQRRKVALISSVSGGSITNAFVAYRARFRDQDAATFRSAMRPLASYLAWRGFNLEHTAKMLRFAVLGGFLAIVAGALFVYCENCAPSLHAVMPSWPVPVLSWLYAILIAYGVWLVVFLPFLMFKILNRIYAWEVDATLLRNVRPNAFSFLLRGRLGSRLPKEAVRLRELNNDIAHIFCATDLSWGSHFIMTPNFLLSEQLGNSAPRDLPAATAVLASAAFPGVFEPVQLSVNDFSFDPKYTLGKRTITLADGGIYDNLGTPFETAILNNEKTSVGSQLPNVDQLIVVNSSSRRPVYVDLPRNPVIARLKGFARAVSVMNEANTAARAAALDHIFLHGLVQHGERLGVLVDIGESPRDACEAVINSSELDVATNEQAHKARARAQKVLALLEKHPYGKTDWDDLRRRNQQVSTTLNSLGIETISELVFQGYVLSMVKCHVLLGYDLEDGGIPELVDFQDLFERDDRPE